MKQKFDSVKGLTGYEIIEKERQDYENRIDELLKENKALKQERRYDESVNNLIKDAANTNDLLKQYTQTMNGNSNTAEQLRKENAGLYKTINTLQSNLYDEKSNFYQKENKYRSDIETERENYTKLQDKLHDTLTEISVLSAKLNQYKDMEQKFKYILENIRQQYHEERDRINNWLDSDQIVNYLNSYRKYALSNDCIVDSLLTYVGKMEIYCATLLLHCTDEDVKFGVENGIVRHQPLKNIDGYLKTDNIPLPTVDTPYRIPELREVDFSNN